MTDCVHGCDLGFIAVAGDRVMPCPRHMLGTHQRWAGGEYEPTGARTDLSAPSYETTTTGRTGLTQARDALPPRTR